MINHFHISIYVTFSQNGDTALMWASMNRKLDVVKTLLAAGADKTIKKKVSKGNRFPFPDGSYTHI